MNPYPGLVIFGYFEAGLRIYGSVQVGEIDALIYLSATSIDFQHDTLASNAPPLDVRLPEDTVLIGDGRLFGIYGDLQS